MSSPRRFSATTTARPRAQGEPERRPWRPDYLDHDLASHYHVPVHADIPASRRPPGRCFRHDAGMRMYLGGRASPLGTRPAPEVVGASAMLARVAVLRRWQ